MNSSNSRALSLEVHLSTLRVRQLFVLAYIMGYHRTTQAIGLIGILTFWLFRPGEKQYVNQNPFSYDPPNSAEGHV